MHNNQIYDITTEPQQRRACLRCGKIAHSPYACEGPEPRALRPAKLEQILRERGVIHGQSIFD